MMFGNMSMRHKFNLTFGIRELHCTTRIECNLVLSCARLQLTFVICMLLI